jgi:hypothetical protein
MAGTWNMKSSGLVLPGGFASIPWIQCLASLNLKPGWIDAVCSLIPILFRLGTTGS